MKFKWSKYIPKLGDDGRPRRPRPKQLAFMMLPQQEALFGGACAGGKALRVTEEILTPFGFRKLSDLKVGSRICATDGSITEIIGYYPQGKKSLYRVTFNDGTFVDTCKEHLWLGWRADKGSKINGDRITGESSAQKWSTQEIKRWVDKGKRFGVPVLETATFTVVGQQKGRNKFVRREIDPYLLGLLLGDGCITANIDITTIDEEIVSATEKLFKGSSTYKYDGKSAYLIRASGSAKKKLEAQLEDLRLFGKKSHEKFIPRIYKLSSQEEREAVLQGLMDTDGWCDEDGDCYFASSSQQLSDDVADVARSLGAIVTKRVKKIKWVKSYYKERPKDSYVLRIKMRDNRKLFRLRRKRDRAGKTYQTFAKWVKSVEYVGRAEAACIQVRHPNSLFITKDFIVTHNSDALLMDALRYLDVPGYKGILFRRKLTDHKLPGSLLSRAKHWLSPWLETKDIRFVSAEHTFYSREGGALAFGYLDKEGSRERYQSSNYQFIGFDELTHFLEDEYLYLFTRLRSVEGESPIPIPCRVRAGTNPGGRGHAWTRERFGIEWDEDLKNWVGTKKDRPFIQAKLEDNPFINKEYEESLNQVDPITRARLRDGDWSASERSQFQPEWFEFRYLVDNDKYILKNNIGTYSYDRSRLEIFFSIDSAASEKTGIMGRTFYINQDPSWSVCGVFGRTPDHHLLWLGNYRAQISIPQFVQEIIQLYRFWRPSFALVESNSINLGVLQGLQSRGVNVRPVHSSIDKIVRSTSAQIRSESGKIWLPKEAPWLDALEGELFIWEGIRGETDDQVDVLSQAAEYTMLRAVGSDIQSTNLRGSIVPFTRGGLYGRNKLGSPLFPSAGRN